MISGLFKYFSTDQDKLERFTNGQVYLTPPKFLNDPWEFLFRREPPTEERLSKDAPFLNQDEIAELGRRVSSAEFLAEGARDEQEILSTITGLVCLTEKPLDRLMWAHYGESHKGFVAEFEHSADEKKTDFGFRACGSPFGDAVKVEYRREQPLLRNDGLNYEEVLLTKHICWEYEKEWRVMRFLHEGDPHPERNGFVVFWFKATQLLRVILGLRAAPEVKFRLRQMLNHKELEHVIKEEVYIDPDSRELKSRPLSW